MKEKISISQSIVSCIIILALTLLHPLNAAAQQQAINNKMLQAGTTVHLQLDQTFNASNKNESGIIPAVVAFDVYDADGSTVVIKAGTPARITYNTTLNGNWGKPGRICLDSASTRTTDNKVVNMRLDTCKNGSGKLGGVIILSIIFFPLGLISGCMKGGMPKFDSGALFNATVMNDVNVTAE